MAGDPYPQSFGIYGQSSFGWECPRCHKINSPSERHCDCDPVGINEPLKVPYIPQYPYYPNPTYPYPYIYPFPGYGEIIITCKTTKNTDDKQLPTH